MLARIIIPALALALAACGSSHSGDDGGAGIYAGAHVRYACGPADGPAYELVLYEAGAPCAPDSNTRSLRWLFYDDPITAGTVVTSTSTSSAGWVGFCPGGDAPCVTSETWRISFDSFEPDVGASGSYSVTWPDGSVETGTFDATWCGEPPVCG